MVRGLTTSFLLLCALSLPAQILSGIMAVQPAAGTPQVATPTFSPGAGTYSSTQSVTISTVTALAVLCYTTDGTTPTESGNLCSGGTTQTYTTPVSVASSLTLKAIGTLATYTDSTVGSAAYTISASGYSDNFPGSSLSGNWSCYAATGWSVPSVASAQVTNTVGGGSNTTSLCGYSAGSFGANQQSQATGSVTGADTASQAICIHVDPTNGNGYCYTNGGAYIYKVTAGATSSISGYCGTNPSNGVVVKLQNVGSTITVYINGSSCATATDNTYTAGYAGFAFFFGDQYGVAEGWKTWTGQ